MELSPALQRTLAWLNYASLLAIMAVLAAVLTAASVLQYAMGELPCPLCLLQRVAMLAICLAIFLQFRRGFSYQHSGIALLFALFLLIMAERQSLLDIYPRPGHAYIGSAVLGLHMPVWSVIIGLLLLFSFSVRLAILGGDPHLQNVPATTFPWMVTAATVLGGYIGLLALLNFGSVVVQCGIGECHTFGYALLGGPTSAPPA